jgi:apolipoprotein N-acyltransferase
MQPALGGLLLGFAYFPGPFLILNLTAFLPLLAWLDARPRATAFERLKAGLLFGVLAELVMLHWMYSMLTWSWLAVLLYLGMSLAVGLRIALAVVLVGWLRSRTGLGWPAVLFVGWVPMEWAQSFGDLRMTGDLLAHSLTSYPFLLQFADLVGPYGVGAAMLLFNAWLYTAIASSGTRRGRGALLALLLLCAAVLAYDGWAWNRQEAPGPNLRVALLQPNIPLEVKRSGAQIPEQWDVLVEQTISAAQQGAELVVWPETARPLPLQHWLERPETRAMAEVQNLARQLGVSLLVGVDYFRIRDQDDYELYNAVMAVDERGRLLEPWSAKIYLVPFVEAVPFRSLLGPLVEGRGGEWDWLAGAFRPGPRNVLFEVAGASLGVLVCYEEFFPDLARGLRNRGAELQVVITNDAWFGRTLFQIYMLNSLRLRAIENRTSYVRAANTGISGFIDRRGRIHRRTELFRPAVEVMDVALTTERTVYNRVGDLVVWLAIAGLLVTLLPILRATLGRR